MRIEDNEMVADAGKAIKRKGGDLYGLRCTLLQGETDADFVEVGIDEARKAHEEWERSQMPMEGAEL